jgi:hypothetical protein
MPLILLDKKNYKIIIPLETLILIITIWAAGTNAPLGQIYTYVTNLLPFGESFLPTSIFLIPISSIIYSLLAGYAVVQILFIVRKKLVTLSFEGVIIKNLLFILIIIVLLISLLWSTILPAFNGGLESQFYNSSIRGYFVPSEYTYIKDYAIKNNLSIVLIPATYTYVQTSWGYQGSADFYSAFFLPAKLFSLGSLGGYALENQYAVKIYTNLTEVISPGKNLQYLNIHYKKVIISWKNYTYPTNVLKVNYSLVDNSIVIENNVSNTNFEMGFGLNKTLNDSNYTYIDVQFNTSSSNEILKLISEENFRIGLSYNNTVIWYTIVPQCSTCHINNLSDTEINVSLFVNQAPNYRPTNTTNMSGIWFYFTNGSFQSNDKISYPKIYTVDNFSINPSWIKIIDNYNISYLLYENSLIRSSSQNNSYIEDEVKYLNNSYMNPTFTGNYLILYKLNRTKIDNKSYT